MEDTARARKQERVSLFEGGGMAAAFNMDMTDGGVLIVEELKLLKKHYDDRVRGGVLGGGKTEGKSRD